MSINCVTESYIYIYMFFRVFFSFFNLAVLVLHSGAAIFVFSIIIFMQIKLELDQEDKDPA